MTPGETLRAKLAAAELLVLPGAFDAISSRIIEAAGFGAVYLTGAGFANASFAYPDIGLIGLSELVEHTRRIVDAVDIPVVVDADTGFGDLLQVRRTIRELERAGAAAIQLEDQVAPKRCGHFDGQRVIPLEDMVQKIAIAIDSRRADTLIIARTDARNSEGFEQAVARARAYAEAGAELIFVEAPRTEKELLGLPGLVGAPMLANMVEGGKTPMVPVGDLAAAGYRVALYPNTALRASMAAIRDTMQVLREQGDTLSILDRIATWEYRQSLVGLAAYQQIEDQYAGSDAADDAPSVVQEQRSSA